MNYSGSYRVADSGVPQKSLAAFFESFGVVPDNRWAWVNYKPMIAAAMDYFGCTDVFEVGGGRNPLFSPQEIAHRKLRYTVNDVDQSELDLLDNSYENVVCANIAERPADGQYDLIFSKMVYEHIEDNKRSLNNQFSMLKPGGVLIHFHPVLYTLPFVINHILPEKQARQLFSFVFSPRRIRKQPKEILKFPTYYHWCTALGRQRKRILELGFSEAELVAIYGHEYYRYFPVIRDLHRRLTEFLSKNDVRLLASYCFTTARK